MEFVNPWFRFSYTHRATKMPHFRGFVPILCLMSILLLLMMILVVSDITSLWRTIDWVEVTASFSTAGRRGRMQCKNTCPGDIFSVLYLAGWHKVPLNQTPHWRTHDTPRMISYINIPSVVGYCLDHIGFCWFPCCQHLPRWYVPNIQ